MRQPVALERVEALEIEHRLQHAVAGRIAVEHGRHVGAHADGDLGIIGQRLVIGLLDQIG